MIARDVFTLPHMPTPKLAERFSRLGHRVWQSELLPPRAKAKVRSTLRRRAARRGAQLSVFDLPAESFIRYAYNIMLRREPDPQGLDHFTELLRSGRLDRNDVLDHLRSCEEFRWTVNYVDLLTSVHYSRVEFVRSLPRARRILDLGGTHQSDRAGAFVSALRYPYRFDELVIVDLPPSERDEIYRHSALADRVVTPKGTVSYRYHSMTDLGGLADNSFDLVYSGQTIEHVTAEDADLTLKEIARVLRPGGHLALDTPNGPVCRMHTPDFINHDHKIEYSDDDFSPKLLGAGLEIIEVKGLNYLGHPRTDAGFDPVEVARNWGVFAEAGDCYLLAYLCRKPL
jgi:SAM-dependent methyltransferase